MIAGSAAAWPLVARAQQSSRIRRVAVVMAFAENDPQGQLRATAFRQGLERAGWTPGRNIEVDYLWGLLDADGTRAVTTKLQRLAPEVIAVNSSTSLRAIQSAVPSVPIVFIAVSEPVGRGFVASLARPGGNMTGFSNLEATLGAKWLDLLKQVAPQVKRVAFMYNPDNPGSKVTLQSTQLAAPRFSVEVMDLQVRDLAQIEAGITSLGREPGGALLLPPDPFSASYRKQIAVLAAAYRLPVVSALRSFADEGCLMSYGANLPEIFRQAASYVDRILRGEKPGNLPVQQPTKFEFIVNLKTAKTLGLEVPQSLLVAADEVIE
jgi:putative ABC transport system substrate-binding protein